LSLLITFEQVGSGRYRYIIRMPIGSHFSTHIGSAAQIKSIAKRLACLEACVRLIECGGLDDHLRPVVIIRPQHIERVKAVNLAETSIVRELYTGTFTCVLTSVFEI